MTIYKPDCHRCLLSELPRAQGLRVCVPGDGDPHADILFYGEAPGANEEQEARPFVGSAGRELDGCLSLAGLRRERVFVSNIVRCRPPNNRDPAVDEIAACRYYTLRELERVKPKVIVALGGSALKALTGKTKIGENRGRLLRLLPDYRSEVLVVATYHPAAGLHQPGFADTMRRAVVEDMRLAQKVAAGSGVEAKIVTYHDAADAEKALALLARCKVVACDLEWEVGEHKGMWPWSRRNGRLPEITSIGFAGRVADGRLLACSVAVRGGLPVGAVQVLQSLPSLYHNATADVLWLLSQGVEPLLAGDSMLLAYLLNVQGSLRLASLAPALTDMEAGWEMSKQDWIGRRPRTLEEEKQQLQDNAKDALATLLLHERELQIADEQGGRVLPVYRELLLPAVMSLARAAMVGMPLDVDGLKDLEFRTVKAQRKLREGVAQRTGVRGFATGAPGSQQQVAYAIEREVGGPLPRQEKNTDKISLAADGLEPFRKRSESVGDLILIAGLKKRGTTYLKPWRELLDWQRDNRLHTVYRLAVARTGRTSAEGEQGGTFQQYPRAKVMRRLVRARDGWKIVAADESQVEMRIAAWRAGDETMLRFFNEGIDIHSATAGWIKASIQGVALATYRREIRDWIAGVTEAERFSAKGVGFGFLFGMHEEHFIEYAQTDYGLTFTMDQAVTARSGFFSIYDRLEPWHDDAWRWVRLGYVDTPTGRRRLLAGEDENGLHRKAINMIPQSLASDLSLLAFNEVAREVQGDERIKLFGFFHDAIIAEVRDDAVDYVVGLMRQHLEHPPLHRLGVDLTVPLVADIKVGQTWADGEAA